YRDGILIKTTPSPSYTDTGLSPFTLYSYTVAAYDYSNNVSEQSTALPVTTAGPSPALMQQSYATPQSPQKRVRVTYADDQAAGNTNLIAIGWNDTTAQIKSVVDSAGNVYRRAIAAYRGNGMSQAIYYAANIKAALAGDNQVTVTFNRAAVYVDLRITEYSGLSQTKPFDVGVSATGNGSLADSGALTTAASSELLFAAGMTGSTFTAPGSGFTAQVITSPDGDLWQPLWRLARLNSGQLLVVSCQ
ncbi:MAG: fibronectin type III domain-containing protein, partial [Deltaproteobacteria bacterium]|nr:fibronectin type III domain-containing protein [Deltaproteobacteria bacterium]